MIDYDATDSDIRIMQAELAEYGITRGKLDLSNYAGCTFQELSSIQKLAIKQKLSKDAKRGDAK